MSKKERIKHDSSDSGLAYYDGQRSRQLGKPNESPESLDLELSCWWHAGWNDEDAAIKRRKGLADLRNRRKTDPATGRPL